MRMRIFLAAFIRIRRVFSFYIRRLLLICGFWIPWKTRMRMNKLLYMKRSFDDDHN